MFAGTSKQMTKHHKTVHEWLSSKHVLRPVTCIKNADSTGYQKGEVELCKYAKLILLSFKSSSKPFMLCCLCLQNCLRYKI